MPSIQRRGAVAVVPKNPRFFDVANEPFLVIRRSSKVVAPLKLCFPGGGIESEETPEEAVRREFWEEVGVEICRIRPIWNNITPWNVGLDWFYAERTDPTAPFRPNDEVAEVFWTSLTDLTNDPDCLESNLPFLQGVLNGDILLNERR